MPKTLRLVLGDQLNDQHSWFQDVSPSVTYLMIECKDEASYVKHHIQKVLGFFAAMRLFADHLREEGHEVNYIKINDEQPYDSIVDHVSAELSDGAFERFEYMLPDEWRLDQALASFCEGLSISYGTADTEHFYTKREALKTFFKDRKQVVMEYFYRHMRKTHDVLIEADGPLGGKWNFDAANRNKLPTDHVPPEPYLPNHDLSELMREIETAGIETIGEVDAKRFSWPLNREESLNALDYFLNHLLKHFGDYQDALEDDYWSLYHSRLSFSLNTKLISPKEVVDAVVHYGLAHQETIALSQIEGFVRQILGWREFMRGIYWWHMPDYRTLNALEHDRPLPSWYWSGDVGMNCLKVAIKSSLEHAYAHHIQRLMVTGNFALLAGCDPDEVDQWYLGIYIDAIEWVEITNTRGMSQYADGGIVGTKPYVAGGSYVHKMGNHCDACQYDYKKKTGDGACPLNSLYWHFLDRHRSKLENNPRVGMMYKTWDRMDGEKRSDYLAQAKKYLSQVDYL